MYSAVMPIASKHPPVRFVAVAPEHCCPKGRGWVVDAAAHDRSAANQTLSQLWGKSQSPTTAQGRRVPLSFTIRSILGSMRLPRRNGRVTMPRSAS